MSTSNLPRVSRKATNAALLNLAEAKLIRDYWLGPEERRAKAYLAKALDPKDSKHATTETGADVATVTMSAPRKKAGTGQYAVTDTVALAAWADAHKIIHEGKPAVAFPEWFTAPANLESLVRQSGGEIPDGLTWIDEEYGEPSVTVRQTTAQQDALLEAVPQVRAFIEQAPTMGGEDL